MSSEAVFFLQQRNQTSFEIAGSYFTSSANYLAEGNRFEKLPPGHSFSNWNVDALAHIPLIKFLSADLGLRGSYSSSVVPNLERTNGSFTEGLAGVFGQMDFNILEVTTGIMTTFPFEKYSYFTDSVMNSEGVPTASWLIGGAVKLGVSYPYLAWESIWRGQGRSTIGRWTAGVQLRPFGMFADAQVSGSTTLVDDSESETPQLRMAVINFVNAGSYQFSSINPEVLEIAARVGVKISELISLYGGYSQTINGKNSAAGRAFLFGLQVALAPLESQSSDPIPPLSIKPSEPADTSQSDFRPKTPRKNKPHFKIKEDFKEQQLFDQTTEFEESKEKETQDLLDKVQKELE